MSTLYPGLGRGGRLPTYPYVEFRKYLKFWSHQQLITWHFFQLPHLNHAAIHHTSPMISSQVSWRTDECLSFVASSVFLSHLISFLLHCCGSFRSWSLATTSGMPLKIKLFIIRSTPRFLTLSWQPFVASQCFYSSTHWFTWITGSLLR